MRRESKSFAKYVRQIVKIVPFGTANGSRIVGVSGYSVGTPPDGLRLWPVRGMIMMEHDALGTDASMDRQPDVLPIAVREAEPIDSVTLRVRVGAMRCEIDLDLFDVDEPDRIAVTLADKLRRTRTNRMVRYRIRPLTTLRRAGSF